MSTFLRVHTIEGRMKAYLMTTGTLFALIVAAHVWRMISEPSAMDPWFLALTVLAAGFSIWAFTLVSKTRSIRKL